MTARETQTPQWERANTENWMYPPQGGWTYGQVRELGLAFDWTLTDGTIAPRGMTSQWHDMVRDGLGFALRQARVGPYAAGVQRCVLLDEGNVPRPDVVVYDHRGLDPLILECVPVGTVALAVEVVAHGSRTDDRFRKPGMYAAVGVPYYWRVERGEQGRPVVYEFWLHHEAGVYAPSPETPVHQGKLRTSVPFPVEIDLDALLEF
jgi:Uma2 family endonuclease